MVLQLFVNGPPGVGKTTIAKLLCEEFNLELLATGDLLRENMKAQTTSGRRAERCIAAKKLIPDRVVLDMVEAKVASCVANGRTGWVLDSFPRTTDQAKELMAKKHLCPAIVLLLELPQSECVMRICGRRFDPVTGAIFHSPTNLPRDPIVRARLTRRRDDTSDRLTPRFEAYRTFGDATIDLFRNSKCVVHRIDASKPRGLILEEVSALLHSLVAKPRQSFSPDTNNNNHAQQNDKANAKMLFKQRPETIPETSEENDDDDMQQYQYDWEDGNSSVDSTHENPQKSQQSLKPRYHQADSTPISSSLMAALPLPDLPPRQGSSSANAAFPPPPGPILRPLPTPTSKIKKFTGPPDILKTTVDSVIIRESINARSSSSGSLHSNCSSTSLETAAASIDMATFRELLLDGFEAVKHGRRGRPHPRLIFTDLNFKRVFWQKALGVADRVGKGKHARLEQSVVLTDVIQVARGMKTAVLKRSGNVARYECYVSLVTPTRTLDLELPNAQLADFLQRGFDQLLHN